MVTGCVGKSCAATGAAASPASTIAAGTNFHSALFIVLSSIDLTSWRRRGVRPACLRSARLQSRRTGPFDSTLCSAVLRNGGLGGHGHAPGRLGGPQLQRSVDPTSELHSLLHLVYAVYALI